MHNEVRVMPRTDQRGGPQTRAKIAEVASRMFLERGYDAVTVAEIAKQAGVSSVTVFKHFPRKENLFLDRADDAVALLIHAVREREAGVDVLDSLHGAAERLFDERNALSGLDDRSIPFFRTVAASPALIARARETGSELQRTLAEELRADQAFVGDGTLLAAFFIAGYSTILIENARRLISGESPSTVTRDHPVRIEALFQALRSGVLP